MKKDTLVRLKKLRRELDDPALNLREMSYTAGEAAQLCGVTLQTIRKWDRIGKIHTFRTGGGHRRILESEIKYIRNLRKTDFSRKQNPPTRIKTPMRQFQDFVSGLIKKPEKNQK